MTSHASTTLIGQRWKPSGLYTIWKGMIARCYGKSSYVYDRYGGRGIKVCQEWKHSFEKFAWDMYPRPSEEYSLDRIDNNGNYDHSNCRWATRKEQSRNQQRTKMVIIGGKQYKAADLAEMAGKNRSEVIKELLLILAFLA